MHLHMEAVAVTRDAFNRSADLNLAAAGAHVIGSGFRKQCGEVGTRQQQVAGGTAGAEAVAQYVEEHLRRGAFERRVERGDAQRRP